VRTQDVVLAEIEAFLSRTGMGYSRFGRDSVNNPAIVWRMRKGLGITARTIDLLRAFMAKHG
jgi:hypothetical protein